MTLRLSIILGVGWLLLQQSNAVLQETHQTTGAIHRSLGSVSFIQDVITVRINFKNIEALRNVLVAARLHIRDIMESDVDHVIYPNTRNLLLAECSKLDMLIPSRSKRSLFSWGGGYP